MPLILETMGTVLSLTTPDPLPDELPEQIKKLLDLAEKTFSRFRPDSEISKINSGELSAEKASEKYRAYLTLGESWQQATNGAFDISHPAGGIDLNGLVKASTMDEISALLLSNGCQDWCLNVGGDVLVSGSQPDETGSDTAWVAGIVDPNDRHKLLSEFTFEKPLLALATSGVSERGEHIWGSSTEFQQVSIAAPGIITADVLATAVMAGGSEVLQEMFAKYQLAALAIKRDGDLIATTHFVA